MILSNDVPLLGINTDPGRSLGILCGKFLYKERSSRKYIERIFNQLDDESFQWMNRLRMNVKIVPQNKMGRHEQTPEPKNILMLNEAFLAEKDSSKVS
mmetsp:Transcript_29572/g.45093  ORF Transcript_29572/g.45093 Transcript_29572/m.45093 type:complete len:98 (+) Transcript_29572:348-641(+)